MPIKNEITINKTFSNAGKEHNFMHKNEKGWPYENARWFWQPVSNSQAISLYAAWRNIKRTERMTQIIIGKCPSKSNCYKVIQLGKHASLAKTKALTDYEKSFYLQCNIYRNKNITGLFEIHLHVYYDSNRADLDNSLKIILDCLQKVNAIKNDNNCVKIIAEKFIDKIKPRIEFTLKPI